MCEKNISCLKEIIILVKFPISLLILDNFATGMIETKISFQVKVMHKQLLLFHNAVSAYFSGNQTALEATLKQFNIKLRSPNTAPPSWLEQ